VPVQADLGDEAAVKRMVSDILARFGRIDALVNCAAIWNRKPLEAVTAADVREHFDANLLGTFLTLPARRVGNVAANDRRRDCERRRLGPTCAPYRDYAAYFPSKAAHSGPDAGVRGGNSARATRAFV